jgi:hypothetical protein
MGKRKRWMGAASPAQSYTPTAPRVISDESRKLFYAAEQYEPVISETKAGDVPPPAPVPVPVAGSGGSKRPRQHRQLSS